MSGTGIVAASIVDTLSRRRSDMLDSLLVESRARAAGVAATFLTLSVSSRTRRRSSDPSYTKPTQLVSVNAGSADSTDHLHLYLCQFLRVFTAFFPETRSKGRCDGQ